MSECSEFRELVRDITAMYQDSPIHTGNQLFVPGYEYSIFRFRNPYQYVIIGDADIACILRVVPTHAQVRG